jgi:uncharacterized protein DUF5625
MPWLKVAKLVWALPCSAVGLILVPGPWAASTERVAPTSVAIVLDQEGVVADFDLRIEEHLPYSFCLRFEFPEGNQAERSRLRRLLGGQAVGKDGKATEPGRPMPLKLSLSRQTGEAGYQRAIDPLLTSWGADNFKKCLVVCDLPRGKYQVKLHNFRGTSEFSGVPVALTVGFDKFKTSFSPKYPGRSQSCSPL